MSSNVTLVDIITINTASKLFKFQACNALKIELGQYATFIFENPITHTIIKRSYSIIEFEPKSNTFCIIIKRIENGAFSRYMIEKAKIGDILVLEDIYGNFILPANINFYEQIYFIAAGSGITPIYALIKNVINNNNIKLDLIYSSKNPNNTILYKELNHLASSYNHLKVRYLFSRNINGNSERLNNSLLTDYLTLTSVASKGKTLFYLCGPTDFMDTAKITILTEGYSNDNIKKEVFQYYLPDDLPEPIDKNKHQVSIVHNNQVYTLQVQFPNSILDTALNQGINLPYSCGSGQCGTCVAKLISGQVWLRYNEILTTKDLENNLILTCQGFPIEGDVTISYDN